MITFTAKGMIEVRRAGSAEVLSQHRVEREAIESCARRGAGRYEITYPLVRVEVIGEPAGVLNISGALDAA